MLATKSKCVSEDFENMRKKFTKKKSQQIFVDYFYHKKNVLKSEQKKNGKKNLKIGRPGHLSPWLGAWLPTSPTGDPPPGPVRFSIQLVIGNHWLAFLNMVLTNFYEFCAQNRPFLNKKNSKNLRRFFHRFQKIAHLCRSKTQFGHF